MRYSPERSWPAISRDPADIPKLFGPHAAEFQTRVRSLLGRSTPVCSLDLEFNPERPTVLGLSDGVLHVSVPWDDGRPYLVELLRTHPNIYWIGHFLISADVQVLAKEGIALYRENVTDSAIWHWLTNMHLCKGAGKTEDGQDKRGKGYMNLWTYASLNTTLRNWKDCVGEENGCGDGRPCPDHNEFGYNGVDAASVIMGLPNVVKKAKMWGVAGLHELHRDLLWAFQDASNYGVMVDMAYVEELRTELLADKERIAAQLSFAPTSPQQVVAHFRKKGITLTDAQEQTIRDAVEDGETDEELALLLEYKELGNGPDRWFKRQYRDKHGWWKGFVDAYDRIHCRLGIATSSGRMMCADPNLNNVGKRRVNRHQCRCGHTATEHIPQLVDGREKKVCGVVGCGCGSFSPVNVGKKLRRAVVASPGTVFIDADYKNGENMVYLYLAGYTPPEEDFHTWMANNIGIDNSHPFAMKEGSARDAAKTVTHACLTGDHEVLTPIGWKRIDKCDENTIIAQWNPVGQKISFVKPVAFHSYPVHEKLLRISGRSFQAFSTVNHKWPVNINGTWGERRYSNTYKRTWAERGSGRIHVTGCLVADGSEIYSDLEILQAVAIQADGSIAKKGHVTFHVHKDRKMQRLRFLFGVEGRPTKKGGEGFYIPRKNALGLSLLTPEKEFDERLLKLSPRQRELFLEEILFWDGTRSNDKKNVKNYFNTNVPSLKWVQTIAHLTGRQALLRKAPTEPRHKQSWRVSFNRRQFANVECMSVRKRKFKGRVYCFTTPSGYFLFRYKNRIAVSSNSDYGEGIKLMTLPELKTAKVKKEIDCGARLVYPDWTVWGKTVTFTGVNLARRALGKATLENRHATLDIVRRYMERFPKIRDLQMRVTKQLEQEGGVRPPHSYFTRLTGRDEDAIKSALAIFGSQPVAHLLKLSLVDVSHRFVRGESKLRFLLPIHDEMLCEWPADADPIEGCRALKATMERETPEMPGFRLKAEAAHGGNWRDLTKVKL